MDNYEIARDRAQKYFLRFDQSAIIQRWKLKHDDAFLYVDFAGRHYKICRKTGQVVRIEDGTQAGFSQVLSIFDFLCHEGSSAFLSGRYAPVNSLRNAPINGGVDTNFHCKTAQLWDKDPDGFRVACTQLGGIPMELGDIGFRIPVFGEISVVVKFYRSDDEFPAGLTLLWDENLLQFLNYETVFYVADVVLQEIMGRMSPIGGNV